MTRSLDDLLKRRTSTRAFTNAPVPREALERMCLAARRAPSGANLQPGNFHVLTGAPLEKLTQTLLRAHDDAQAAKTPPASEYNYFPDPMPAVLKQRQRAAGFALYDALKIEKRDLAARRAQFSRNYRFFDAPVGAVVTIQRDMGKGCFMDLGMSIMAFLLSCEDQGFGASGIGALANYGPVVHNHLNLPQDEMVVCGIAIGQKDNQAAVNRFKTDRATLEQFTAFQGFE